MEDPDTQTRGVDPTTEDLPSCSGLRKNLDEDQTRTERHLFITVDQLTSNTIEGPSTPRPSSSLRLVYLRSFEGGDIKPPLRESC